MADRNTTLKLLGIEFSQSEPTIRIVRFEINSSVGAMEASIVVDAVDLHEAVEEARQEILSFAQELVQAASTPVFLKPTNP